MQDDLRPKENIGIWYHELSKDISMGGQVQIPEDKSKWPKNWKIVEYKEYGQAKQVSLLPKKEGELDIPFSKVIMVRRSSRNFQDTKNKINLKNLSSFISNTIAEIEIDPTNIEKYITGFQNSEEIQQAKDWLLNNKLRVYPSGGSRYPLEFYFLILRSEDIDLGLYHYNVKKHCLEYLSSVEDFSKSDLKLFGYEWIKDGSVIIFTTAIFNRNFRKYGERGYRYILLEAGHVGQNFYLTATALGLNCIATVGTVDKNIEKLLSIDGVRESLVYTFVLG